MNSAFTHQRAGTKAGRLAHAARCAAVACALVLAAGGALAQQYGERRDDQNTQQGHRAERFQLPPDRTARQDDPRNMDAMRNRPEYQDRQDRPQVDDRPRNGGRMTQDERRDLRRQINEAGRDLYQRQR
jgi:hypothetical protein